MKVRVIREDGQPMTIELPLGQWTARVHNEHMDVISGSEVDYFFLKDGAYDGWEITAKTNSPELERLAVRAAELAGTPSHEVEEVRQISTKKWRH